MPTTLSWGDADLNSGTDDGVVHENTANTAYGDASEIRKGDPTASPLYANDLVLWCPLQESSGGTAYDFSGNNRDGTVQGATQVGGTDLTGLPTYSFDNTDDYVEFGDLDAYQTFPLSVSAWFKTSQTGAAEPIVSKFATSSSPGIGLLLFNGDLTFNAVNPANNSGDDVQNTSTANWTAGEWQHAVGVWSGDPNEDLKLYLNGTLEDSTPPQSVTVDPRKRLTIGSYSETGIRYFGGSISDVRLYNRELTQSEIQDVYDVFAAPSKHTSSVKTS